MLKVGIPQGRLIFSCILHVLKILCYWSAVECLDSRSTVLLVIILFTDPVSFPTYAVDNTSFLPHFFPHTGAVAENLYRL